MTQTRTWIRVARCQDIPLREGRAVKVAGREIAMFNLGDRFLAVANQCPHKGGPLADGIVSGAAVVCPLHARKFSLENGLGLNSASAASCVETFRTRVESGVIWVEIDLDLAWAQGANNQEATGQEATVQEATDHEAPNEEADNQDLPLISFDSTRESGAGESSSPGQ